MVWTAGYLPSGLCYPPVLAAYPFRGVLSMEASSRPEAILVERRVEGPLEARTAGTGRSLFEELAVPKESEETP